MVRAAAALIALAIAFADGSLVVFVVVGSRFGGALPQRRGCKKQKHSALVERGDFWQINSFQQVFFQHFQQARTRAPGLVARHAAHNGSSSPRSSSPPAASSRACAKLETTTVARTEANIEARRRGGRASRAAASREPRAKPCVIVLPHRPNECRKINTAQRTDRQPRIGCIGQDPYHAREYARLPHGRGLSDAGRVCRRSRSPRAGRAIATPRFVGRRARRRARGRGGRRCRREVAPTGRPLPGAALAGARRPRGV